MKKLSKLLLAIFLFGGIYLFFSQEAIAQEASNCSIIGNNMAFYNQGAESDSIFQESSSTLILLPEGWFNVQDVINAINQGQNIIVRLGAGGETPLHGKTSVSNEIIEKAANEYITIIEQISAATGGKHFFATAGHNEANCGEPVPYEVEKTFTLYVSSASIPNVTWISGQVDFYCGIQKDEPATTYISAFAGMSGIKGISLPFYPKGASEEETVQHVGLFQDAVNAAGGKPIYVTESGPYKEGADAASREEFLAYATGIKYLVEAGNLSSINLFNAFGINPDNNYFYTEPFWSFSCREAFRTQCSDPEAVTEICFTGNSGKRDPYYVEPIAGIFDFAQDNFQDPEKETFDKIYEDLVAQGYQAYCSIPDFKYMAGDTINPFIAEQILASESPGNRVSVTLQDYQQFFNYIDAQTPIWRKKGIYVLKDKDSMEAFWTHKDEMQRIGSVLIDYNPADALITPFSQCQEKTKILNAINKKCNNLTDPSTCALNIYFHPKSSKFLDLYKEINNSKNNFSCNLMEENEQKLTPIQKKIRNDIMQMPFALPTAYRFAFAVYVADLREPRNSAGFDNFTQWSELLHPPGFDFLRFDPKREQAEESLGNNTNQIAQPRSEIRILAFLVPDFGTNLDNFEFTYTPPPEKNFKDGESQKQLIDRNLHPEEPRLHVPVYGDQSLNYKDGLKIVRDTFLTPEQTESYQSEWRAKKEKISFEMGNPISGYDFDPNNSLKKLIECLYYDDKPALKKYRCEQPLELALTTFINRRTENPENCGRESQDVEYQKNNTIFADAGIQLGDVGLNQKYEYQGASYDGNILKDGFYPQNVANVLPNQRDTSGEGVLLETENIDAFRFLSHYVFTEFSSDHSAVVEGPEPEKGTFKEAYIDGYLVYPQGYELESIEDALLSIFLTPEQIKKFNQEEYAKYFKMEGVETDFDLAVGKTGLSFWKSPELRDGQCLMDYNLSLTESVDPDPTYTFEMYAHDNCMQNPEATVKLNNANADRNPRILGGRLGMITIKIQQALRASTQESWRYVTSCFNSEKPFEDFLLGRCTGELDAQGKKQASADKEYMNQAVATCRASSPRIGNRNGLPLTPSEYSCTIDDSIDSDLGSQNCDPNDPILVKNCAVAYAEEVHEIVNWLNSTDRVKCDEDFYSFIACGFNKEIAYKPSLIAHLVNASGRFTPDGIKTACEYVQDRAAQASVSPRLALAMWLEESGASAYSTEAGGSDFGVISAPNSRESGSIELQLKGFLGTINSNRYKSYPQFLLQYSDEHLYGVDPTLNWSNWKSGDPVLFCRNRAFAGRLKDFYEQLAPYLENGYRVRP